MLTNSEPVARATARRVRRLAEKERNPMRYFEEMESKWGFGDGEATPAHIDLYRKAYVLAINRLAEAKRSQFRAVAFDRCTHNSCLIVFTNVSELTGHTADELADGSVAPTYTFLQYRDTDAAMSEAYSEASDMEPDSYVEIDAKLDEEGLNEALTLQIQQAC
jgi:hypothetical protein